jgi:hypothetical protein
MTKLTILIFILLTPVLGYSQKNLVFNRIFTWEVAPASLPSGVTANIGSIIIPEGYVWKIENAIVSRGGYELVTYSLVIGNFPIRSFTGSQSPYSTNIPFWVSSGNYPIKVTQPNAGISDAFVGLNVIEYKIE